jgi:SAM-dependent methyltransferase
MTITTTSSTATTTNTTATEPEQAAGELAERLFGAALGAIDLLTVYLGVRLGLYRALADHPGCTPDEFAVAADIAPRYAVEWLEQQTIAGFVACDDRTAATADRTYRLPAGHDIAFLAPDSPAHVAPLALAMAGIAGVLPDLLAAYRAGGGVPYARYGADFRDGQAGFNRPGFVNDLADNWLRAIPDIHARLTAGERVRIADVACGAGWSTIAMARAFPNAEVVGFDLDEASIADARRNALDAGMGDRTTFEVNDGAALPGGSFDLVCIFEAVHDLSQPVEVLAELRRLRAPGGHVLVMDEGAADSFAESDGPLESFLYGCSVLHCLPVGLADQPSVGTGTVMRPATLAAYAIAAGFERSEILPVDHDMFRFYELV